LLYEDRVFKVQFGKVSSLKSTFLATRSGEEIAWDRALGVEIPVVYAPAGEKRYIRGVSGDVGEDCLPDCGGM
jgi:hypothetical protein